MGAAGLLGLSGGQACGGGAVPAADVRQVTEIIAGASAATWFVGTQHNRPLAMVAATDNLQLRDRLLAPMCDGSLLSAIGITHLRRRDRLVVRATRVQGGWLVDGDVAWVSSWGIADVVLLAAESTTGEVVFVIVPARDQPDVSAGSVMQLAAMQATSTVSLHLTDLFVADQDVAAVHDIGPLLEADRAHTANVNPAVLGVLATVVRHLGAVAERRGDRTAGALAQQLAAEREALRDEAYALIDDVPPGERIDDRLALRAAALELTMRAATALVVATGGSAMSLQAPAQRLLREAAFFLVQAQNAAVREATLRRLGHH